MLVNVLPPCDQVSSTGVYVRHLSFWSDSYFVEFKRLCKMWSDGHLYPVHSNLETFSDSEFLSLQIFYWLKKEITKFYENTAC